MTPSLFDLLSSPHLTPARWAEHLQNHPQDWGKINYRILFEDLSLKDSKYTRLFFKHALDAMSQKISLSYQIASLANIFDITHHQNSRIFIDLVDEFFARPAPEQSVFFSLVDEAISDSSLLYILSHPSLKESHLHRISDNMEMMGISSDLSSILPKSESLKEPAKSLFSTEDVFRAMLKIALRLDFDGPSEEVLEAMRYWEEVLQSKSSLQQQSWVRLWQQSSVNHQRLLDRHSAVARMILDKDMLQSKVSPSVVVSHGSRKL